MIGRLAAKAVLLAVAAGMAFFGIGLLGSALAASLVALFGTAGAYAVAGGVLLLPPLFWALAKLLFRPKRREPPPGLIGVLAGALARNSPMLAAAGAAVTAAVELFLNRNKPQK